jgi:hypothetical protein
MSLSGSIKDPTITCNQNQKAQRLGTRLQMNSGLWATVCSYNSATNVDVMFEVDGMVAYHKQ